MIKSQGTHAKKHEKDDIFLITQITYIPIKPLCTFPYIYNTVWMTGPPF